MPEFLKLVTPQEALSILFNKIDPRVESEIIPVKDAFGRVANEVVLSPQDLPEFRRSTVDGYSVLAKNTHGASDNLPAYLRISGEVPMGSRPDFNLL